MKVLYTLYAFSHKHPLKKIWAVFGCVAFVLILVVVAQTNASSNNSAVSTSASASGPPIAPTSGITLNGVSTCAEGVSEGWVHDCLEVVINSGQNVTVASCSSVTIPLVISNIHELGPLTASPSSLGISFNTNDTGSAIIIPGGSHVVGYASVPGTVVQLSSLLSFSKDSLSVPLGLVTTDSMTVSIPCDFPTAAEGIPLNVVVPMTLLNGVEANLGAGVFVPSLSIWVTVT